MKLHRNAKTTPTMRALIVHRIRQEHWPPTEAAAAAGVSVRTTYKWLRRHRLGGEDVHGRAGQRAVFGRQLIADPCHFPPLQFENVRTAGGGRHGVGNERNAARSLGG